MAGFTERISVVIDVAADKAVNSLKSFKSSVQEAEGFTEKMKVGAKSLGVNANMLLAGAGAALVGVAIKGSQALSQLAKSSLDLGKATGMSTEQSSRWIAIADDAGISAETLQSSIGKIAKSLDSGKWEQYGIATRDASGQARDASAILTDALGALSNVTNETERARIGNELFGKGFANLAPLLGHTSEQYKQMLGTVSDGQVITAQEAAKTEKLRLAQDSLNDALKDVTMALGGVVVAGAPVLEVFAKVAEEAAKIAAAATGTDAKSLTGATDKTSKALKAAGNEAYKTVNAFSKLMFTVQDSKSTLGTAADGFKALVSGKEAFYINKMKAALAELSPTEALQVVSALRQVISASEAGSVKAKEYADKYSLSNDSLNKMLQTLGVINPVLMVNGDANKEAAREAYLHGEEERRLAEALAYAAGRVQNLDTKLEKLKGNLDANDAIDNAITALEGIGTASQEAWDKTKKGAPDAAKAQRDVAKAIRDTQQAVIDLENEDLITHPQAVKIQTAIDQGDYETAKKLMDEITRPKTAYVSVVVNPGTAGPGMINGYIERGGIPTNPLGPPKTPAGTPSGGGGGGRGPDGDGGPNRDKSLGANRPMVIQLQLNDRTVQEIAIRADQLKVGRT